MLTELIVVLHCILLTKLLPIPRLGNVGSLKPLGNGSAHAHQADNTGIQHGESRVTEITDGAISLKQELRRYENLLRFYEKHTKKHAVENETDLQAKQKSATKVPAVLHKGIPGKFNKKSQLQHYEPSEPYMPKVDSMHVPQNRSHGVKISVRDSSEATSMIREQREFLTPKIVVVTTTSKPHSMPSAASLLGDLDSISIKFKLTDMILGIGGTVGGVMVLCLLIMVTHCCCQKKKRRRNDPDGSSNASTDSASESENTIQCQSIGESGGTIRSNGAEKEGKAKKVKKSKSGRSQQSDKQASKSTGGSLRGDGRRENNESDASSVVRAHACKPEIPVRDRIMAFEHPPANSPPPQDKMQPKKKRPCSKAYDEFENSGVIIGFGMRPKTKPLPEDIDEGSDVEEGEDYWGQPFDREHDGSDYQEDPQSGPCEGTPPTHTSEYRTREDDEGIHSAIDSDREVFNTVKRRDLLKSYRKPPPPQNRSTKKRPSKERLPISNMGPDERPETIEIPSPDYDSEEQPSANSQNICYISDEYDRRQVAGQHLESHPQCNTSASRGAPEDTTTGPGECQREYSNQRVPQGYHSCWNDTNIDCSQPSNADWMSSLDRQLPNQRNVTLEGNVSYGEAGLSTIQAHTERFDNSVGDSAQKVYVSESQSSRSSGFENHLAREHPHKSHVGTGEGRRVHSGYHHEEDDCSIYQPEELQLRDEEDGSSSAHRRRWMSNGFGDFNKQGPMSEVLNRKRSDEQSGSSGNQTDKVVRQYPISGEVSYDGNTERQLFKSLQNKFEYFENNKEIEEVKPSSLKFKVKCTPTEV